MLNKKLAYKFKKVNTCNTPFINLKQLSNTKVNSIKQESNI